VNVRPAERANHGRRAPGFQAERDARAKKAQERCDLADVSPMKSDRRASSKLLISIGTKIHGFPFPRE